MWLEAEAPRALVLTHICSCAGSRMPGGFESWTGPLGPHNTDLRTQAYNGRAKGCSVNLLPLSCTLSQMCECVRVHV